MFLSHKACKCCLPDDDISRTFFAGRDVPHRLSVVLFFFSLRCDRAAFLCPSALFGKKVRGSALRDEFSCPITRELMRDPVIAADGHTYDREAIEMWLRNHDTSPKVMDGL